MLHRKSRCFYPWRWGISGEDEHQENEIFFKELLSSSFIRTVDHARPVAGHIQGYREYNENKILVTKGTWSCVHEDLEEGDWSGVRQIFERMWGRLSEEKYFDPSRPAAQIDYFYSWLRRVLQAIQSRSPIAIQFFGIGGPPDSGKTWVQEVVLDFFLGGHACPSQYMDGDTLFNSEFPHLMLSDKDGSPSIQKRRKFGGYIKRITSNKGLECRGLYKDEITLDPIRVPTCSFNTSPAERIKILPPLDEDIRDKMIITKVEYGKMPLPTATPEEELEFKKWTQDQLPAFAWWLMNKYVPPADITLDSRFGIPGYCHPEIERHLFEMSPERRLLDFLDDVVFSKDKHQIRKITASELEQLLNKNEDARAFIRRQSGRFSDMLADLARARPDRVEPKKNNGQRFWLLKPPGGASTMED